MKNFSEVGSTPYFRDRKKMSATLLEGKIHSPLDDFSLQVGEKLPAAENP